MFNFIKKLINNDDVNTLQTKYDNLKIERDKLFQMVLDKDAKCGAYLNIISVFVNDKTPSEYWDGARVTKTQLDMINKLKEINKK